jgi:hypothetical protein
MCPYETGRTYTSVDIDVSTDVNNSYLGAAKVLNISRKLSAFLNSMACTFKKNVTLQNPSGAINYNRGTTELLSEKTVDRRRIF